MNYIKTWNEHVYGDEYLNCIELSSDRHPELSYYYEFKSKGKPLLSRGVPAENLLKEYRHKLPQTLRILLARNSFKPIEA